MYIYLSIKHLIFKYQFRNVLGAEISPNTHTSCMRSSRYHTHIYVYSTLIYYLIQDRDDADDDLQSSSMCFYMRYHCYSTMYKVYKFIYRRLFSTNENLNLWHHI